ncbi:hypothetical protein LCGC14_2474800, partial [marine sediment metagenome]
MEDVIIKKEDLSKHDCGGGYRRTVTEITVDSTQSPENQQRTVIYELLSSMLDSIICHDKLLFITHILCDALDEIKEGEIMDKEAQEKISDDAMNGLLFLTEHDRTPTWLELDRFFRALGY